jgi:hypothetical protein
VSKYEFMEPRCYLFFINSRHVVGDMTDESGDFECRGIESFHDTFLRVISTSISTFSSNSDFHRMALSSNDIFIERHFHRTPISLSDIFVERRLPQMMFSSDNIFVEQHFRRTTFFVERHFRRTTFFVEQHFRRTTFFETDANSCRISDSVNSSTKARFPSV